MKRLRVSARTDSDPTMQTRTRERSSDPARLAVRTASSSAKLGTTVNVEPNSEHVRSQLFGLVTNFSGVMCRWISVPSMRRPAVSLDRQPWQNRNENRGSAARFC